MPSHLEAIPGIVLAIHGLFAIIKHTNPIALIFITVRIRKFILILLGKMKFKIKTDIRIERNTLCKVETIYEVYRNLNIDVLEFIFIFPPVAIL